MTLLTVCFMFHAEKLQGIHSTARYLTPCGTRKIKWSLRMCHKVSNMPRSDLHNGRASRLVCEAEGRIPRRSQTTSRLKLCHRI